MYLCIGQRNCNICHIKKECALLKESNITLITKSLSEQDLELKGIRKEYK